jgi:hypothetical protein
MIQAQKGKKKKMKKLNFRRRFLMLTLTAVVFTFC